MTPASPTAAAATGRAAAAVKAIGRHWRWPLATGLLLTLAAALLVGWPEGAAAARWALFIFGTAIVAWTVLELDETPVAMAAALALLAADATSVESFYAGMGDEFIWLLVGAFIMAAVLQTTGVLERWALSFALRAGGVPALFRRLTLFIAATAFIVPSTSGRAALLLPVFVALLNVLPASRLAAGMQHRLARALALLFPSVILLSACASMLGAGAHLVALDFMDRLGGPAPGFFGWVLLAAPFGLLSSVLACEFILRGFLSAAERDAPLTMQRQAPVAPPLSRHQGMVLLVFALVILAWCTHSWHGVPAPLVAVAGAMVACVRPLTGVDLKTALKKVEWNLVLFMAATLVMGESLLNSGAAQAMAEGLMAGLALKSLPAAGVLAVASGVALLAHLLITSRTARATVLIPTVALPLAATGVNPALLIFVVTLGSGFCQTLSVSAKPVALFSGQGHTSAGDWLRLSLALLPAMGLLLLVFALWVWPAQGLG